MDCWQVAGVCIEKRLDLGNAALVILGLVGFYGLYLGHRQLKASQRAQQTQLAYSLLTDFFSDRELRTFMYRLDYTETDKKWTFVEAEFRHSPEEACLDLILYKLSAIGMLVKSKDLLLSDLEWATAETRIVIENQEVQKYVTWLQSWEQIPGHSAFAGAMYLYQSLIGQTGKAAPFANTYLDRARMRTTSSLPWPFKATEV